MSAPAQGKVERTNFEGSWNDVCQHCGKIQQEHRVTNGPYDSMLYEHRMPCEQEKEKIRREHSRMVLTAKTVILIGWVLVPFAYLLLQQFVTVVGWIAFSLGVLQLCVVTIKHFGNPDKWIPGHKAKMEKQRKAAHYIYHCERNPEGFARLRAENFERAEREGK